MLFKDRWIVDNGIVKQSVILEIRQYLSLLFSRWKVATFIIATAALEVFGLYAGDPTWDLGSVALMSTLTFITAPWVVSKIARSIIFRKVEVGLVLAFIFWICSVSISYELYVYFKFGSFAEATNENFAISSTFYFLAGLFWNLKSGRNSFFEFSDIDWPNIRPRISWKVLFLLGVPLSGLYVLILLLLIFRG